MSKLTKQQNEVIAYMRQSGAKLRRWKRHGQSASSAGEWGWTGIARDTPARTLEALYGKGVFRRAEGSGTSYSPEGLLLELNPACPLLAALTNKESAPTKEGE